MSGREATLVGLILLALFLSEAPSVVEGFYWLPGAIVHSWALCLLLAGMIWYLRLREWRVGRAPNDAHPSRAAEASFSIGLTAITAVLAGLNESVLVLQIYLTILAAAVRLGRYRRIEWPLVIPTATAVVCLWIAFQSPGNDARLSHFPHSQELARTLARAPGFVCNAALRYLQPAFLLAMFLSTPAILAARPGMSHRFYAPRTRWTCIVALVVGMMLFVTPAYWAMGVKPPKRALNVLCFMYMLGAFVVFVQFTCAYPDRMSRLFLAATRRIPTRALTALFFATLFLSGNIRIAWWDLLFEASAYEREVSARAELYARSRGLDVSVPPFRVRPRSLFFDDVTENASDWRNTSVAQYYGLRSVTLAGSDRRASRVHAR